MKPSNLIPTSTNAQWKWREIIRPFLNNPGIPQPSLCHAAHASDQTAPGVARVMPTKLALWSPLFSSEVSRILPRYSLESFCLESMLGLDFIAAIAPDIPLLSLIIPYSILSVWHRSQKKTIQDHSNISRPFKNIKDLKDPKGILRILQNQSQHTNKADEIWQRIWNTSIQWVKIRNRLLQIVKLHFFSRSLGWCGSRICFF